MKMPLILLSLIVTLVAACMPAPVLRDDKLLQDDSIYTGEPCAAPCFYGITPGETAWHDALTIIEDNPEFTNIKQQGPFEDNPAMQAAWQQGADGSQCCEMTTQDGETVSLVFLRTAPDHTMADLVEVYGTPVYLIAQEFTDDQAVFSLVYPDVPMLVYAFVEGAENGVLSADSEIIGALYTKPEDMELLLQTTDLHEWEGYQSFADYMSGEFEITPSVTLTPTPE